MQKSKSTSLSEKEKQKIINIIHAKVTPLKFKFKKVDKHAYTKSSLLPQLQKQQNLDTDQAKLNKRISVSTYIEMACPFNKDSVNQAQPRESVLLTQNIKKQQEELAVLFNQYSPKQNLANSTGFAEPFDNFAMTLTLQYPEKLMAQMNLLQKKKMLKNVKKDVQKKKTQILLQMINQRQIKREQKQLHKKYNPNFKHAFKESHYRNTQANQLLHLYSKERNKPPQFSSKNRALRNSLDLCIEHQNSHEDQTQNNKRSESSINDHKEAMKLKDFINFFKDDQQEGKKIRLEQCHKLRNQKSSKFIHHHQSFAHSIETSSKQVSMRKISMLLKQNLRHTDSPSKTTKFKPRHGFINKTVHFTTDQQNQNDNNLQCLNPTLTNAKLRMRLNHKKIVSLGKMQKKSLMAKHSKYDFGKIQ